MKKMINNQTLYETDCRIGEILGLRIMDYSAGANVYEYLEEESNEDVLCFINKCKHLKGRRN